MVPVERWAKGVDDTQVTWNEKLHKIHRNVFLETANKMLVIESCVLYEAR